MEHKANDLSNIKNINVNEPRSIYTVYSQSSTLKSPIVFAAGLAQSVGRLTAERVVPGSIPGAGPLLKVLK